MRFARAGTVLLPSASIASQPALISTPGTPGAALTSAAGAAGGDVGRVVGGSDDWGAGEGGRGGSRGLVPRLVQPLTVLLGGRLLWGLLGTLAALGEAWGLGSGGGRGQAALPVFLVLLRFVFVFPSAS